MAGDFGDHEGVAPTESRERVDPYEGAVAPLELIVDQLEDGQVDSTVALGWCIDHELVQWLTAHDFNDPYVLISVTNGDVEMSRTLVKLTKEMAYVQLFRAGKNVIHAAVVNGPNKRNIRNAFLTKVRSGFETSILMYECDAFLQTEDEWHAETAVFSTHKSGAFMRHPGEATLTVEVDEKFFASDPARWRMWLVNRFYSGREDDQCDFRKRFLISAAVTVTVYWEYIILKWLASLVTALVCLIGGARDIDWGPVRNPFSGFPTDVAYDIDSSVWVHKANGQNRHWIHWVLLNPLGVTIATTLLVLGVLFRNDIWPFLLGIGIGAGIVFGVIVVFRAGADAYDRRRYAGKTAKTDDEIAAMLAELEAMVCRDTTPEASLQALPREKRSAYLRFQETKRKVCKPRAR